MEQVLLSFFVEPFEGPLSVMPVVNSSPFSQLVWEFEKRHDFEPAGGYGGLIPAWFDYGPLRSYFLGDSAPGTYFAKMAAIYILGCECGEVGCWPLCCRVQRSPGEIVWDSFRQPHRQERDYSQFGPFVFSEQQYLDALSALDEQLSRQSRSDAI